MNKLVIHWTNSFAILLLWQLSSSMAWAQLYAPEIKVEQTSGDAVMVGSATNPKNFRVYGTLYPETGVYLPTPGSSPAGSSLSLGSPYGNPGFIIYVGDGSGNVYKRWNILGESNTGTFSIQSHGNNSDGLYFTSDGKLGIGDDTPGHTLTVNGSAWCTSGIWVNSDAKTKKNIKEYHKGLDVVAQLHPIQYELKAGTDSVTLYQNNIPIGKKPRPLVSVMAQELQSVAPELVETYLDEQAEETLSINQTGLLFVLMNAIKDQQQFIEELQKEVEALKATNKEE